MIVKSITYTDYKGQTHTKDFYFNYNRAELAELEMSTDGGLEAKIRKIINAESRKDIVQVFKRLLLDTYGEVSDDGEEFMKSPELRNKFEHSAAFPELFMELSLNSDKAYEFVMGVIPAEMAKEASKIEPFNVGGSTAPGNLNAPIEFPIQSGSSEG